MNPATGTGKYEQLLKRCESLIPIPTAVAHPCDPTALSGAMDAEKQRLIVPILVGPVGKIREIAASTGIDLGHAHMIDVPHSHAAAA